MTTLTAESSPELSGQTWLKVIAVYGVGPVLALLFGVWMTTVGNTKLDAQVAVAQDTKALLQQHIEIEKAAQDATNDKLDLIARQLAASCRVQALLAKNKAVEPLCEVGR